MTLYELQKEAQDLANNTCNILDAISYIQHYDETELSEAVSSLDGIIIRVAALYNDLIEVRKYAAS